MKKLITTMLSVSMICAITGCSTQTSSDQKAASDQNSSSAKKSPIKIGTLYPQSGPLALFGTAALHGAEIAREIVNNNGGVNGAPVEFVNADAKDASSAATEANRLISQEKVKILTGSISSNNSLQASAVAERNQVVFWETTGIDNKITDRGFKYLFRFADQGEYRGKVAIDMVADTLAAKLGTDLSSLKVAIVNEDSSYGSSIATGAVNEAKAKNVNIVAHETYSSTASDLTGMILRLKSKQPDIIIASSYINDATLFVNQAKQQDLKVKSFIGTGSGYSDPQFVKAVGESANGVISIDSAYNIPVDKLNSDTQKLANDFHSMYKKEFNSDTVPLAAELTFAATYNLLHDVLPKAGSDDPDKVIKAAQSIDIPQTIVGWSAKYDAKGQNTGASPIADQWENGKMSIVWPEKFATKPLSLLKQ